MNYFFYFRVFTIFHYEKFFKGSLPDPNKYFHGYVNTFLKTKLEASGRNNLLIFSML